MRYQLHFVDSRGNVSASLELQCSHDGDAIGLLDGISPICLMELWQEDRLVIRRDGLSELKRDGEGPRPETSSSFSVLQDLDHRIQDCERNLILVRADIQRLRQDNQASDLAEQLAAVLADTLSAMIEYRSLLIASIRHFS